MGGMEFNKIFAAILVAGIVAMLGGFVAKQLVHPHKLHEDAFKIEAAEEVAGGAGGAPAGPQPIMALIAAADVAKGEKISKACAACHTFTKGGPAGVGPNLWGVVGGPKDHMPGYAYSGALLEVGGKTWTYEEMNKFLWKPKAYAAGTKMSFAGLKKPEERAALLAWLRTQADSPAALPTEAEIATEQADLGAKDVPADGAKAPAAGAMEGNQDGNTQPAKAGNKELPPDADTTKPEAKANSEKALDKAVPPADKTPRAPDDTDAKGAAHL